MDEESPFKGLMWMKDVKAEKLEEEYSKPEPVKTLRAHDFAAKPVTPRKIVQVASGLTTVPQNENTVRIVNQILCVDDQGVAWEFINDGIVKRWERFPDLPTS